MEDAEIQQLSEQMIRVEGVLAQLSKEMSELNMSVRGDGRSGLIGRVMLLEGTAVLLDRDVRRTSEAVFGNGKMGLAQRIATIEQTIDNIAKVLTPISISIVLALLFFVGGILSGRVTVFIK